jgi:hypothetical protein
LGGQKSAAVWLSSKNWQLFCLLSPQLPTIERVTEEQAIRNAEEWPVIFDAMNVICGTYHRGDRWKTGVSMR